MDFQVIQDSRGHWRIKANGWSPEELLVPEARRLHKKLGDLIVLAEQANKPPIPRFGDH